MCRRFGGPWPDMAYSGAIPGRIPVFEPTLEEMRDFPAYIRCGHVVFVQSLFERQLDCCLFRLFANGLTPPPPPPPTESCALCQALGLSLCASLHIHCLYHDSIVHKASVVYDCWAEWRYLVGSIERWERNQETLFFSSRHVCQTISLVAGQGLSIWLFRTHGLSLK